jgi:1,4-dihydroxy-2-naphthoate octaprenyltransferase
MQVWILAARPKTLIASISPVLIGSVLALSSGTFDLTCFLFTLATALGIQIGTNFANDYFDFIKGADTAARKGPTRATQAGLVLPKTMKRATGVVFALTALSGCYLVWQGGLPIAFLLALSILLGILYTGGPFPLAYLGLGDLFVLLFFGPIAVVSTDYLQTHLFSWEALLAGLSTGALSSALLVVNNLRDIDEDRLAEKRTLPVRWGRRFGKIQYLLCLLCAFLPLPLLSPAHPFSLLAFLALLPSMPLAYAVLRNQDPSQLNAILAKTGQLLLIYTLLFCVGWLL